MSSVGDVIWRVTEGCRLLWREWDDEHIVYNTGSGDTHLLDTLSAEALRLLGQSPSDVSGLVEALSGNVDPESVGDLDGYVESLVDNLHKLGLIEPFER